MKSHQILLDSTDYFDQTTGGRSCLVVSSNKDLKPKNIRVGDQLEITNHSDKKVYFANVEGVRQYTDMLQLVAAEGTLRLYAKALSMDQAVRLLQTKTKNNVGKDHAFWVIDIETEGSDQKTSNLIFDTCKLALDLGELSTAIIEQSLMVDPLVADILIQKLIDLNLINPDLVYIQVELDDESLTKIKNYLNN